ncbi:hypothetical protein ACS0TY_008606 [Phlomoides rotata]
MRQHDPLITYVLHMNPQIISWFSCLILILIHAPNGSSNLEELYQTCGNTFSCGRITGIGYPFRRSDDPAYCGHPSFVLTCDDHTNATTLEMIGTKYRVLKIDQNDDIMTIAREDIMEEACPRERVNTTLDHTIFDYDSSCKNFTFFYGCPGGFDHPPPGFSYVPCGGNQGAAYVVSGSYGPGICNTSVIVPGTGYEVRGGSVNSRQLDEALQKGFEIKWQIDGISCSDCLASKGRCGNDLLTNRTVCYCPHPPFISDTCPHPKEDPQNRNLDGD